MSDTDTKSLFASKTFWGAIIAAGAGLAGIFGGSVTAEEQSAIVNGISGVGVVIGTIIAIVGRIKANKKVG